MSDLNSKPFSHLGRSNIVLLSSAASHSTASWACGRIPPDVLRSDWLSNLFPHWSHSAEFHISLWIQKKVRMIVSREDQSSLSLSGVSTCQPAGKEQSAQAEYQALFAWLDMNAVETVKHQVMSDILRSLWF